MVPQAAGLSSEQIRQVATFLTGREPDTVASINPNANLCTHAAPAMKLRPTDWANWGVDLGNTRFQRQPGISIGSVPHLKVKWVFAYPGSVVDGQPTVTSGRVFVSDRAGWVFSLDAKTGCTYWSFAPNGGVRTAVVVGALPAPARNGAKFAAYFVTENGFVQAVNAETGKPLWVTRIESHPVVRLTGSPILFKGRIYVGTSSSEELESRDPKFVCCTSRGALVALNAATGNIIWTSYTVGKPERIGTNSSGTPMFGPAGASIWSTPTIDTKRNLIYANTGNSFSPISVPTSDGVVAFDLKTGNQRWVTQALADDNVCTDSDPKVCPSRGPDRDMNAAPILATLRNGKQIILAAIKTGDALALDPDANGRILWRRNIMPWGNGWGYSADEKSFYFNGRAGLAALDAATGEQRWLTPASSPACSWKPAEVRQAVARFGKNECLNIQSAASALMPDVIFSGALDGHMRAYRTVDGAKIWDFDTGRRWDAVNGIEAKGGSINYGAQAIDDGMLYVNSGSGGVNQPGNALIAFSVDGE
jgi:polyvinyl alcohol dehydrogenase (cytochrome)